MKNLENITLLTLIVVGLLFCSSCSYRCNGTWAQRKNFDNNWKRAQNEIMTPNKIFRTSKTSSFSSKKKYKCAFTSN